MGVGIGESKADSGSLLCCGVTRLPIIFNYLLVLTISLMRFSMIPVMGDIAVEISQGLRFVCAFFVGK